MSDLHLSQAQLALPALDADLSILAGDVARPTDALHWAAKNIQRPVIFVAGNHEYYGASIAGVNATLAQTAHDLGINFLNQSELELCGVRFLGATLWTDFELFGPEVRDLGVERCASLMRDFEVIKNADGSRFRPEDSVRLFREQYAWLDERLDVEFDGPTVVITHHAPYIRSVHPRFADSVLSTGFASDCWELLGRADLWVHGHCHDSFDYTVRGTRVVCNPRGYWRDGNPENPEFDPGYCLELAL